MVQVENEELLYGTGTGYFAGFFSTSGILRHNVAGATDTTALGAIEQAIEQMRSGPALAEPDLFITSPSSWSALRRIKYDLHRYILSPDPTREEANQLRPPVRSGYAAKNLTVSATVTANHGTTSLFAALEVATGKITADACYPRHTHVEFLAFLKLVAKAHLPRTFNGDCYQSDRRYTC